MVDINAVTRGVLGLRTPDAFLPFASGATPTWLARVKGQTTVRTQHIYMTCVIANGGDTLGPHRWRVPV